MFHSRHGNYFSWSQENSRSSLCPVQKRSDQSVKKKASRTFHGYIWYFKLDNCIKNRGFWEVLKQIRDLYANMDRHLYIHIAFRELHSEKQSLEHNTQIIFRVGKLQITTF